MEFFGYVIELQAPMLKMVLQYEFGQLVFKWFTFSLKPYPSQLVLRKIEKITYWKKNKNKTIKDKLKSFEMYNRFYLTNMCTKSAVNRLKFRGCITLKKGPYFWCEKLQEKRCGKISNRLLQKNK